VIDQAELIRIMTQFAYEPAMVYGLIILLLTLSSFGLPMPEEITLISAGAVGYFALHPETFPPPYAGAQPVNPWTLAFVCLAAVFLSDLLIYWLGRLGRGRLRQSRRFRLMIRHQAFKKTERLVLKHGAWMAGVFRFTPGLRFPGHMACGFMGLPQWKFIAVDGTAALLTVPTQVLLVSYYGDEILSLFKQFKLVILAAAALALCIYLIKRHQRVPGT